MPLDAVVFNIGGVLVDWDPRQLYRKIISDDDAVEQFLSEVTTPQWSQSMDQGRPMQQAIDELSELFPESAGLRLRVGLALDRDAEGPHRRLGVGCVRAPQAGSRAPVRRPPASP